MKEEINKNIRIRLADGRFANLKLIVHSDDKFETIIITDEIKPEKVFSKQCDDMAEAQGFWNYLLEERHVPEPTGKYRQLAIDLEKAKIYAWEHMGDNDTGSFNFDSPYIYLPRWRQKLVSAAAKTAGLSCDKLRDGRFLLNIPEVGDCCTRTKAAELMCDFLKELGYHTGVFYMLD